MARRSPIFRRRSESSVALPWEQRAVWLRAAFSGSRWRAGLLIVALLAGVLFLFLNALHIVRMHDTRSAIGMVHRATQEFRHDHGRCPAGLDELQAPAEGRRYLTDLPEDGWGQPLFYQCPARFDDATADVVSAGPSGSFFDNDNVR